MLDARQVGLYPADGVSDVRNAFKLGALHVLCQGLRAFQFREIAPETFLRGGVGVFAKQALGTEACLLDSSQAPLDRIKFVHGSILHFGTLAHIVTGRVRLRRHSQRSCVNVQFTPVELVIVTTPPLLIA